MPPPRAISKKYNPMNDLSNKERAAREKRMLPFFVEFVKFSAMFAVIIAVALLTLQAASAAMN